ncbi:hexosaminidase [Cohaesibacter sp. ES.047]|uniref:beta-N-acetylhexosaminidase n=1 Tax=Cohaesibacter sp. ES.047 TaxID=1798205 RepID=UPI000BB755BD|nr:family 20 glycosylhydrolase [Cohaesibacter sp. ES.047]SNY90123.1 hexosaminidase [Cohaesibacter sp. ES.047]
MIGQDMSNEAAFSLESHWIDDGSKTGQMHLSLASAEGLELTPRHILAFTAITRIPPGTDVTGARFVSRTANYHELAPEKTVMVGPDTPWRINIPVLSHRPAHCTDGPKSAFILCPDGETIPVDCAPLAPEGEQAAPAELTRVHPEAGEGTCPERLGLIPMAKEVAVERWSEVAPASLSVAEWSEAIETVNALFGRIFPNEFWPFRTDSAGVLLEVVEASPDGLKSTEGYRLDFSHATVTLTATGPGLHYGLIALAQIWRAARTEPESFHFPLEGYLSDEPAHDWRGMHLDVSRQIYTKDSILDFLDRLAWHRLNRFHWHLTDDEGWRFESKLYPQLTQVGAWRGHRLPLLPQHGSGAARHGGFFSQADIKEILDHATSLSIEVVPEIDVPGHCYAALVSVPELVDPSAMAGGVSVQGYVNNALNPGLSATWQFLERIFGELSDLFPGRYIHMGGDEVADAAWAGSRAAESWARAKGHVDAAGNPDSMKMQAALLRFVSDRLVSAGKVPMAWEEAAKGGGLDPEETILMAWMKAQSGPELVAKGYRVVMCPGEAYYLDMAQSDDWHEPGLSWAGTSSPQQTYDFDPLADFDDTSRVLGLQGCIWSENLVSRSLFNHMVFPRFSAIAESAWTRPEHKRWQSFAARQSLIQTMPPTEG